MDLINETTPLINPTIHHSQQDNVDVQYPSIPVSELILKVNEILNSTTGHHHSGVSDLVSMGGDAAFYAVVKTLLDVPDDKRDILQLWAINILDILLERDAYHTRIRSILLHDWEDQGSALDTILQVPATTLLLCKPVQAGIQAIWTSGQNYVVMTDPPFNFKQWVTRYILLFIDKWRSPKYQSILQFVTACTYISLYLATVANQNYTSFPPHTREYVFYVFASSDILIETLKVLEHPWKSARSIRTHLGIISSYMILVSFIWRVVGLNTRSLPDAYQRLHVSLVCLAIISPIMFIRLLFYARSYDTVSRIEIQLCRCLIEASWILAVGAIILLGFWVAVAVINTDKSAWDVLQLLALGALFAPEIGDTLLYEPQVIGVLLFIYLFLTTVLLSSLLTASFISTFLSLRKDLDKLVALQFARIAVDALKAGGGSGFGAFVPGILVECVLVYPLVFIAYLYKRIIRHGMSDAHQGQAYQKFQRSSKYLNYWRQMVFFTIYSPFFIAAILVDLLSGMARYLASYFQRKNRTTTPSNALTHDV